MCVCFECVQLLASFDVGELLTVECQEVDERYH